MAATASPASRHTEPTLLTPRQFGKELQGMKQKLAENCPRPHLEMGGSEIVVHRAHKYRRYFYTTKYGFG